jgi:hypothetical protein
MNAREIELMQFTVAPRFLLVADDELPSPTPLLTHYPGDSASTGWLQEMAAMDREDSWTPAQRYRRVVSLDFISGCADQPAKELAA